MANRAPAEGTTWRGMPLRKKGKAKVKKESKTAARFEPPNPRAGAQELRDHFRLIGEYLACVPYDIAIATCLTCGRQGENTIDSQYGHPRFCSHVCEAVLTAYERTLPKPAVVPEEGKRKGKYAGRAKRLREQKARLNGVGNDAAEKDDDEGA